MSDHATRTRRQIFGAVASALGAAGAAALGGQAGRLQAAARPAAVDRAASASEPAVRLDLLPPEVGELGFPVDPADGGLIVLDNFGGRSVSQGACSHDGIDIFPTTSAPRTLLACTDAVIEGQRFFAGSQGNAWILQDGDGVSYRYHHIATFAEGLEVGDVVRRGQPIGIMGSSGNAGSPHLHIEVRLDGSSGTAIDPLPLLVIPDGDIEIITPQSTLDCR